MDACDYCGAGDWFGYTCKLCSRTHCKSHRLPETHDCPNLDHALPPGWESVDRATDGEWTEKPYVEAQSVDVATPDAPQPLRPTDVPTYGTPPEEDLDSGPDMAPDGSLVGQTDTTMLEGDRDRDTVGGSSLVPSRLTQYTEAPSLLLFDLVKLALLVAIAVGLMYLL